MVQKRRSQLQTCCHACAIRVCEILAREVQLAVTVDQSRARVGGAAFVEHLANGIIRIELGKTCPSIPCQKLAVERRSEASEKGLIPAFWYVSGRAKKCAERFSGDRQMPGQALEHRSDGRRQTSKLLMPPLRRHGWIAGEE